MPKKAMTQLSFYAGGKSSCRTSDGIPTYGKQTIGGTFETVAESWKKDSSSRLRISSYATYTQLLGSYIIPYFGGSTAPSDFQGFVESLVVKGLSLKTMKDTMTVLRMVLRYGVGLGIWEASDTSVHYPAIDHPRIVETISLCHQKRIVRKIRENPSAPNIGIMLSLYCGLRIGEICALQWKDIDFERGIVHIVKSVGQIWISDGKRGESRLVVGPPKTISSYREVPIPKELLELLTCAANMTFGPTSSHSTSFSMHLASDDLFIISGTASPMAPRKYRDYFKRFLDSIEVPRIRFHALRHTFATRCIEEGCDAKSVAAILGHASVSTTFNYYVHPSSELKRKCVERGAKAFK